MIDADTSLKLCGRSITDCLCCRHPAAPHLAHGPATAVAPQPPQNVAAPTTAVSMDVAKEAANRSWSPRLSLPLPAEQSEYDEKDRGGARSDVEMGVMGSRDRLASASVAVRRSPKGSDAYSIGGGSAAESSLGSGIGGGSGDNALDVFAGSNILGGDEKRPNSAPSKPPATPSASAGGSPSAAAAAPPVFHRIHTFVAPDHLHPIDSAEELHTPLTEEGRALERYTLTVETLLSPPPAPGGSGGVIAGASIERATALNPYDFDHVLDSQLEFNHFQSELVSINRDADDADESDAAEAARVAAGGFKMSVKEATAVKVERNREFFGNKLKQIVIDRVWRTTVWRTHIARLFRYLFFLFIVTWVGVHEAGRDSTAAFSLHSAAVSSLVTRSFVVPPPVGAPAGVPPHFATFESIQTKEEFWSWVSGPFADTFYPTSVTATAGTVYAGDGFGVYRTRSPLYVLNAANRIIGVPRFRLQRSTLVECDVPQLAPESRSFDRCFGRYPYDRDATAEYGTPTDAYQYQSAASMRDGAPVWGWSGQWYDDGGGYTVELPPLDSANASTTVRNKIQTLIRSGFIDLRTRVVFVEFGTYNPNENQYVFGTLTAEFLTSGDIVTSYNFK